MSYVKGIAGAKPKGWGWAPGLRGYVKGTPGVIPANWRWAAGLRGVSKIVVGGLGCGCRKSFGDPSDDNFGIPSDLVNFSAPTATYPASPESGISYVPSGEDYATPAELAAAGGVSQAVPGLTRGVASGNYSSSGLAIADALAPSLLSSQTIQPSGLTVSTVPSLLSGISNTSLILGGVALFAVALMARRR